MLTNQPRNKRRDSTTILFRDQNIAIVDDPRLDEHCKTFLSKSGSKFSEDSNAFPLPFLLWGLVFVWLFGAKHGSILKTPNRGRIFYSTVVTPTLTIIFTIVGHPVTSSFPVRVYMGRAPECTS